MKISPGNHTPLHFLTFLCTPLALYFCCPLYMGHSWHVLIFISFTLPLPPIPLDVQPLSLRTLRLSASIPIPSIAPSQKISFVLPYSSFIYSYHVVGHCGGTARPVSQTRHELLFLRKWYWQTRTIQSDARTESFYFQRSTINLLRFPIRV